MIHLHHIVCLLMALLFLWESPPGLFVGGVAVMEMGSAVFNLALLYPKNRVVRYADIVVMTSTNIFGMYCAYILWTNDGTRPMWVRYVVPVIMVILVEERQRALHDRQCCRKFELGPPVEQLEAEMARAWLDSA